MTGREVRRWWLAAGAALMLVLAVTDPLPAQAVDGAKLVLVLDSSGSMKERVGGDTKISIAKSALQVVVKKLPANAQVGLRVYGATVFDRKDPGACTDSQLVVPIGTDNRAGLRSEITKYKPYGETPISYSLKQAALDLGKSGQRTIVLVSDGEETCDVDPCLTAASLAKQGIDLRIDVIGLGVSGQARSQLTCVADKGNGTYYDANDAEQIEESLDKLATRAFRPFTLSGTPVEGSPDKSDGPVVTPGQYLDNLPGDDAKLYYRVPRTIKGSTLHVAATTIASRGDIATLFARLYASDGSSCGNGLGSGLAFVGARPLVSASVDSWVGSQGGACATEPELLLEVNGSADLRGRKFELLVSEEPPVTNVRRLPPAVAEIPWQPMKPARTTTPAPVAGNSLSDAPVLTSGTYTTKILTGENQIFAVNTDWGQRLQVQAIVAPRRGALAKAVDFADNLQLDVLGADRGAYTNLQVRGKPTDGITMADDAAPYRKSAATPSVTYLNRNGTFVQPASVPGQQYVLVNMSRDSDGDYLLPYTLVVQVLGTAGEGAPQYVEVATPSPSPTPTPTPSSRPATGGSPSSQSSPSSSPASSAGVPLPVVFAIAGGAVVLGAAGAGAAVVLRRRRRPTP